MNKQMPEIFFDRLCSRNSTPMAVVGMTKNVGKTVTLNYLINCSVVADRTPGLVSAGYDGERFDRLTLKAKPRIYAPKGAIVATAKACLDAAGAVMDPLFRSRASTPLGEVWIARVKEAGLVELAGPGSVNSLKMLIGQMVQFGAEPVLVDGAINRLAAASPSVTGEVILASGAAVSPVLEDVIRKTLLRCFLLETPVLENAGLLGKAREVVEAADLAVLYPAGSDWSAKLYRASIPLIAGAGLKERCCPGAAAVVFRGALIDQFLEDLLKLPSLPLIVLRDATKFFITSEIYFRYLKRGGLIRVLNPIKLLAITLNPTDPLGKGYPSLEFLKQVGEALAPRPVFDLVLNTCFS